MSHMLMQYMHILTVHTYMYMYAQTVCSLLWNRPRLFMPCYSSWLEWQAHHPTTVSCLKSPSVLISPQIIGQLSPSLRPCHSCLRNGKARLSWAKQMQGDLTSRTEKRVPWFHSACMMNWPPSCTQTSKTQVHLCLFTWCLRQISLWFIHLRLKLFLCCQNKCSR